jgi:hypothetical protein
MADKEQVSLYAAAIDPQGEIGQLLVTRSGGKEVSREWTGKTYGSAAECEDDLARLNRHLGRAPGK